MENHPIPQDITGFQFKLIGSMTLKQFGYVAGGAIIAWVFYILPLFFLIKLPLLIASVGLGASLAFLPIEGRPMDQMIVNFFKAVFNPTQYIYQKAEENLAPLDAKRAADVKRESITQMSEKQLKDFLEALPQKTSSLDKKEMVFFQAVNQYGTALQAQTQPGFVPEHAFANQTPTNPQTPPQSQSEPVDKAKNVVSQIPNENLQKTAALLEKELRDAKARESAQPQINTKEYLEAHQKVLELQKNLNDILFQKQQLEDKLIDLQKKFAQEGKQIYSPSIAQQEKPRETKFVRSIPQNMQKGAGLPIASEFPNIITGIVKDPRGNPLQNILVEVKDGQGNAVRAFKTNALGQFVSATPLVNGDYTIEFEDPKGQNKFDKVGFRAEGQIILPIEVISVDTREELRRSLFN